MIVIKWTRIWLLKYVKGDRKMVEKRRDLVTMGGNPVTLIGREIKIGDKAPDLQHSKVI